MQIHLSKRAQKQFDGLQEKNRRQVREKLAVIKEIGRSCHDIRPLKGTADFFRVDVGEYRIVLRFHGDAVEIPLIGKRNDDEVYRKLKRLLS